MIVFGGNRGKSYFLLLAILMFALLPFTNAKDTTLVSASNESTEEINHEWTDLGEKIDRVLQDSRLDGTVTGVTVRHADTGEVLYSRDGDKRLRTASNMKLLTAAAALVNLGPEYRFETEVLTDQTKLGVVMHGNLYLRGKGDPTLMEADLIDFAKDLIDTGIHKIEGNIIGDDTWYDVVRLSQDLNW